MKYDLDCYQVDALRDCFKKFAREWFLLQFPLACKRSVDQFNELYIFPLRADLEIAMHNGHIAPLGTPDVIPFALVMPNDRVSLSRQYELYGFKNRKRFINYVRLEMLEGGPGLGSPYIIANINCGKPVMHVNREREYGNRILAGEHRLKFEELLSIMKLMDLNPGLFPITHQAAVTGSHFISDDKPYVPYADFGNANGVVLNYVAMENVFCAYRGVMTYEKVYRG